MSQNPYAQFGPPGSQQFGGDFIDPTPSRTSVLAIVALVISIVGCIFCIVPGTGAIAAITGGLAVFFIARSSGRLRGTGIAVTAIVLGLFQSVALIAVLTGMSQVNTQVGKKFFVPVGQMMAAIEAGDVQGARATFTKDANAAITDEMLIDFAKRYHAKTGAFQKMPENVLETVTMFWETVKSAKKQNPGRGNIVQPHGAEPQIPMPARFAQGSAFVMIVMDPSSQGQNSPGMPPLVNVGVVALDGTEIWLRDPTDVDKAVLHMPGTAPASPPDGSNSNGTSPDAPKPAPAKLEPAPPESAKPAIAKPGS